MIARSMIAAAALALLASPGIASAQSWTTDDDYPPKALRERREGTTYFTAVIGINGRAKTCTVTQSSGSADLDEAACAILIKRGRWKPATDENGVPIEASFSSKFRWQLPNR